MPSMPWTPLAAADPGREYVVMATRFVLSSYRRIPAFVRSTQALWPELTRSAGLLGYSLDADLTRRTFHTLSVWRDSDAITAFVRSDPHTRVVTQTRPWMTDSTLRSWTVRGTQLPVTWDQVHAHFSVAASQGLAAISQDVSAVELA